MRWLARIVPVVLLGLAACKGGKDGSDGDEDGGSGDDGEPVPVDPGEFSYLLEESPADVPLWTTPTARRIAPSDRAPEDERSGLKLSAARGEFEPVQLIIGPASGDVTVSVAEFPDLGGSQRVVLGDVGFDQGLSEHITPISSGSSISLDASEPHPVWLTVYVPPGAPAGDHETTLTLEGDFGSVGVPVSLYVFDFDMPGQSPFATQINIDVSSLIPDGGEVDDAKNLLFEHRFTPKSVTWPSGFNWGITWESGADPCNSFNDEPDEPDQFSIGWLARRYILGEGWNGEGFPTAMLFQFVDNSTPRPGTFCGIDRGDHYGSDAYNAEWQDWLGELDQYLVDNGYIDKAYYYVQNEPQNDEDHALAAHLCRLTRQAAPNLEIAISEEPKPEIAEDAGGDCGYDIWIAHIRAYQEQYAWERQRDHGETVWFYSLDQDPEPFFNPTIPESQGMHARIIPWTAWAHRITGWAFYDGGRFFNGRHPGVRAELLREGIEDYAYLWLANESAHPVVFEDAKADVTALSVATSMTSWTRDPDALMALRHELGLYIEGTRDTLPKLAGGGGEDTHPRDNYYLNFQDPAGEPSADPLVVRDKTWMKIGWSPYDDDLGYGWYGENVDNPGIALYGFDNVGGYDEVASSYTFDDYGRDSLFEFALENGKYQVTVAVGRPAKGYPGDPHNLVVEGEVVVDDEVTTDAEPQIVRTLEVDLIDGSLSLEVGGMSESSGNWAYTFLAYVEIEPVD